MLFDPKWEKKAETKANPCDPANFIAWLETQDANKFYDFHNCRGQCLVGQYMVHMGLRWFDNIELFCSERMKPFRYVSMERPFTFGAALKRARETLRNEG